MRLLAVLTGTAVGWAFVALAPAGNAAGPPTIADQQGRLAAAKLASRDAAARSAQLEQDAAREADRAVQARVEAAAVAARVAQARADIAAGEARAAIVARLLADDRARLAERQAPIALLLAALESFARRPALIAMVEPGSIDDVVHVRAVLASSFPVIAMRTAGLRADLARIRTLQASAVLAARALTEGRVRLERQRGVLAAIEDTHRRRSRALGRTALVESDRAIGLGERARDIVDLMGQINDQAATRVALAGLPAPLARPGPPAATALLPAGDRPPVYVLPVTGRLVTGLGELSDAGVRSRGLTFDVASGATVVAPAAGRIAYAARFRGYGVVVIIDHGGGWTSLIAGLGETGIAAGASVTQRQLLGRAPAGDAPRVTIELRRRDRAVDLIPLLQDFG